MTIEKLQKIATSISDAKYKARWLRWWNSSEDARRAYHFPMPKDKDNTWDPWLNKASFWAEVRFYATPTLPYLIAKFGRLTVVT